MSDDQHRDSFEDAFRRIAEGVGDSFQRAERGEFDGLARAIGVDPDLARRWAAEAAEWIDEQRGRFEGAGPAASGDSTDPRAQPAPAPARAPVVRDPLGAAGPHPLDLPTEEQGAALAALASSRWTIEPGTSALSSSGEGPGPSDALGLVRELRVRDWIGADGTVTLAGRHALERWLEVPR
jgi:hypothetical protein